MAIPTSTNTYGQFPSRKSEREIVLKDPKVIGFKYPLDVTPGKGYFSKSSGIQLVKSSLKSLLKTQRGERFMLPDYGCNLLKFVMEPLDETTFNLIKEEIDISIRKYLKAVNIELLQVLETRSNNIDVKLVCSLNDSELTKFDLGVRI